MHRNLTITDPEDGLRKLPWKDGAHPLMLAPLQGLTNRETRALFIEWVEPDVVFTEFMRVSNAGRKPLLKKYLLEATSVTNKIPLVVQLVGTNGPALVAAARNAEAAGARHINLNMGCPYGRMTSGATGGAMLQHPERLGELIHALRGAISGTFSIKLRAGYNDPEQVFSLLPLFESAAVDFLVLHTRTVIQKYTGSADHDLTARVVAATRLPVIANGDIRTVDQGLAILERTRAAGLMLGRGAISDPQLFSRLRKCDTKPPSKTETATMLQHYLSELLRRYRELFCGEQQILNKFKNVLSFVDQPAFAKQITAMKRAHTITAITSMIEALDSNE